MSEDEARQIAEKLFTTSSGVEAARLGQLDESNAIIDELDIDTVVKLIEEAIPAPPAFTITDAQLKAIMPALHDDKRAEYLPHIVEAMLAAEVNTAKRAAAFLAQIAHESAELKFMAELWGPTEQQKKYEPHTDLSKTLGNTEPGDGFKYRGRGPIQITGRANYKKFSELLGVDLLSEPDLAEKAEHAFRVACAFWQTHGLNELADAENFKEITHRINGGFTGLADRERYYAAALKALGA
jgi:predicted chitinase